MKKIVIKLGGSSLQNLGTLKELIALIVDYRAKNTHVILVHGGGPAINQELTKRGIQWQFINGQRQTTMDMMEVIEEVLATHVNSLLVNALLAAEIPAVGLGAKAMILQCSQASAELMQVGKIEHVNVSAIESCLKLAGHAIPVIAPIGIGVGSDHQKYNINADWAAAKIAIALNAEELIFLTDQDGILDQDRKLIQQTTPYLIQKMIASDVISGGMYTKVMTMMSALAAGIKQVRVINASAASQLHTNDTLGTLLLEGEVTAWN